MRGAAATLASRRNEASKSKPKIKMTAREPSKENKGSKIPAQTSSLKVPAKSNLKTSSKLDPKLKKPSKALKTSTKTPASKRKASASDDSESEDEDEAPRRGLPSKQRTPSTELKRDNIFIQFGESGFADDLDSNFIDNLQLGQDSPLSPVRSVNDSSLVLTKLSEVVRGRKESRPLGEVYPKLALEALKLPTTRRTSQKTSLLVSQLVGLGTTGNPNT